MRKIIRLGDPTSHGGKMLASGASHFTVEGIPVVLMGDLCSCPISGHSGCTVAEGNPHHLINGIPVAYHGHKTNCGAELLSTLDHFMAE